MKPRTVAALAFPPLLLGGILALNLLLLESRQLPPDPVAAPDPGAALERLAGAVRLPTVSRDGQGPPVEALRALRGRLERDFPRLHRPPAEGGLTREILGESLLYTWEGQDPGAPRALLLAHQDVVPADDADDWTHPPFAGVREAGFLWGRGTLDDKASLWAWLEAIEDLLAEGFRPRGTVVLAFGQDEEVGGRGGARVLAAHLRERGERFGFVLDEGGMILEDLVPGVRGPVAVVGIAEKGYLTLELVARGGGGHSSLPAPGSAVARLAAAVGALEEHSFPARIDGATAAQLDFLAPESRGLARLALANRALFEPLILRQLLAEPKTAATVRTTVSVTRLAAGQADNVVPREARATVNLRLLPGDSVEAARARVAGWVAEFGVELEVLEAVEASPVSDPDSAAFRRLQRALARSHPGVPVTPYLCVGGTDAKHYHDLADGGVLRFLPLTLDGADLDRLHGRDERIAAENYAAMIAFYRELLRLPSEDD